MGREFEPLRGHFIIKHLPNKTVGAFSLGHILVIHRSYFRGATCPRGFQLWRYSQKKSDLFVNFKINI